MHGVDGWTVHPMLDDDCMMIPGDQVDTAAEGHRVGLCSTQQWLLSVGSRVLDSDRRGGKARAVI